MFRLNNCVLVSVLLVSGCSGEAPPEPFCRTQENNTINEQQHQHFTNAGCLIRFDQRTLLVTHRLTGQLDIPGGMQGDNESLACTAHRETFEETGLNVEVLFPVAQTKNGMLIFSCLADNVLNVANFPRPTPDFLLSETSELSLYNLYELDDAQLRFEEDLIPLRDAFVLTPTSAPLQTN